MINPVIYVRQLTNHWIRESFETLYAVQDSSFLYTLNQLFSRRTHVHRPAQPRKHHKLWHKNNWLVVLDTISFLFLVHWNKPISITIGKFSWWVDFNCVSAYTQGLNHKMFPHEHLTPSVHQGKGADNRHPGETLKLSHIRFVVFKGRSTVYSVSQISHEVMFLLQRHKTPEICECDQPGRLSNNHQIRIFVRGGLHT